MRRFAADGSVVFGVVSGLPGEPASRRAYAFLSNTKFERDKWAGALYSGRDNRPERQRLRQATDALVQRVVWPACTVLDVACGTGQNFASIRRAGARLVAGFDLAGTLAHARRGADVLAARDMTRCGWAHVLRTRASLASFDVVVCCLAVHYARASMDLFLCELDESLHKAHGKAVFVYMDASQRGNVGGIFIQPYGDKRVIFSGSAVVDIPEPAFDEGAFVSQARLYNLHVQEQASLAVPYKYLVLSRKPNWTTRVQTVHGTAAHDQQRVSRIPPRKRRRGSRDGARSRFR